MLPVILAATKFETELLNPLTCEALIPPTMPYATKLETALLKSLIWLVDTVPLIVDAVNVPT